MVVLMLSRRLMVALFREEVDDLVWETFLIIPYESQSPEGQSDLSIKSITGKDRAENHNRVYHYGAIGKNYDFLVVFLDVFLLCA